MSANPVTRAALWHELEHAAERLARVPTRALLAAGTARFSEFSVVNGCLTLDYSRQHIDSEAMTSLRRFADAMQLRAAIDAMFRGDTINTTELRPALHVALRQPVGANIGGAAIAKAVLDERARMLDFAERVRSGAVRAAGGTAFRTVVNIGIGGSDLGPAMAVQALRNFRGAGPRVEFVSNVDGCALGDLLEELDAASTLFIIASKTFTTQETMANAHTARAWIAGQLGSAAVPAHFAAVSVNTAAMDGFGVHPDHRFLMWDWVGGRYSLWSSIGVSLAIAIGASHFLALLAGGHAADNAFRHQEWRHNLPVLMALLGVWNINFQKLPTLAVLPYDSRLARFPAFLQQLDMESNGKSVTRDGSPVDCETAPVVWGEPGNNAQHSFFQMLHQGTPRAALDMLLPARSSCGNQAQHELVIANCLAQAEVFARGQNGANTPTHKVHAGDRPVSLLLFERLDPATLGALVATFEHKVFAQSIFWGINAFDQWGVELGKKMADSVLARVRGDGSGGDSLDGTLACLKAYLDRTPAKR